MNEPTTAPLVVAEHDDVSEVAFYRAMETGIKKILGRYPLHGCLGADSNK